MRGMFVMVHRNDYGELAKSKVHCQHGTEAIIVRNALAFFFAKRDSKFDPKYWTRTERLLSAFIHEASPYAVWPDHRVDTKAPLLVVDMVNELVYIHRENSRRWSFEEFAARYKDGTYCLDDTTCRALVDPTFDEP